MRRSLCTVVLFSALTIPLISALGGINEWTYVGLAPEEITDIEVHPTNPDIIYASALDVFWDTTREGGLFKTTDRGLTWDTLGFRHSNVMGAAIDRTNPETLWIADGVAGAWRSTDGGLTWENRSTGMFLGGIDRYAAVSIAVCPHNPAYLLCGTGCDMGSGHTYLTTDGGLSWAAVESLDDEYGGPIAFDQSSSGLVYAATDGVFMSADTGRSFVPRTVIEPIDLYDLATAPRRPAAVWYTSLERGVLMSEDSGATWHAILTGLANWDTIVFSVDIVGSADTIVAATNQGPFLSSDGGVSARFLSGGLEYGGPCKLLTVITTLPLDLWVFRGVLGLWTYTADSSGSSDDRRLAPSSVAVGAAYPNPTQGSVWIPRLSNSSSETVLNVHNILGQLVMSSRIGWGTSPIQIVLPPSLPSGTYFITVGPSVPRQSQRSITLRVALNR